MLVILLFRAARWERGVPVLLSVGSGVAASILNVKTMEVVKFLPSPDVLGFLSATGISGGSDLIVLSRSGQIYKLTDSFETVSDSRTGRTNAFDLSAIGTGGELVLMANTEGCDFDVFNVNEQTMLMSNPGIE